ncbi:MAG: hypothetical protein RLZZ293_6 [Pseudomonadota bacterium]|jgi:TatD DNase family protein
MLIDSHCHLNFPELANNLADYLAQMEQNKVSHALCVATRPENIQQVIDLANRYPNIYASVGIHPDERLADFKLSHDYLFNFLTNPKVIAIGETGLDYYHCKDADMSWQHERFILHIEVAKQAKLPLIIHTRESAADCYQHLKQQQIDSCGAVMHCFSETKEWARQFLDLGCYISLSGIVTFKSAKQVQEVAKFVPLDRLLVETDAPFLAPAPYRGKLNHPALVMHAAQFIADLRQISLTELAQQTSDNFFKLFSKAVL